jgi:hypothetical protein
MRNYADIEYDVDQVLHYLNRCVDILDQRLVAHNSDQTFAEANVALSEGYDYISVPTRCLAVREVWTEPQIRIQGVEMDDLYYRRQFKRVKLVNGDSIASGDLCKIVASGGVTDFTTVGAADSNVGTYFKSTGTLTLASGDILWKFEGQRPNFWTHVKNQIQFEAAAGTDYNVNVIYDIGSDTLTESGDMPYNGTYDNQLREVCVQMIYNKKNKQQSQTDAVYAGVFDQVLSMDVVNRTFKRKLYKLDF